MTTSKDISNFPLSLLLLLLLLLFLFFFQEPQDFIHCTNLWTPKCWQSEKGFYGPSKCRTTSICIGNSMIFGINTTSDISKLLYIISRAVRRVKFETILKYHEWYLCKISRTNHAINCLYHCSKPIKLQKFLM